MTTGRDLPPAISYVYDQFVIDLGECVIRQKDGQETPLVGMPYDLLALLLTHPRRVFSYRTLAEELRPEFKGRRRLKWDDLDQHEQETIKHALHALACRARVLLGERGGTRSLLLNVPGRGYAIQRPLSTLYAVDPDERGPRTPHAPKALQAHDSQSARSARSAKSAQEAARGRSNESGHDHT